MMMATYLIFLVTCILYFATGEPGEARDTLWFFNLQIMPINLTMTLCYCATKKDIRFVEFQGPVLLMTQVLAMAVTNFSGVVEMKLKNHNSIAILLYVYFLLYIGLLTTQFKWHFFTRFILVAFGTPLFILFREQVLEKSILVVAFMSMLFFTSELIFYVQMKAQVKLFIAGKVITLQE